MADCLRGSVQAGGQSLKRAFVCASQSNIHPPDLDSLPRQSADVPALKIRQFCILVVEASLCVRQLLTEKVGCPFSGLLAGIEVFADKQRGDFTANQLRGACVLSLESDKESGHSPRPLPKRNRTDSNRLLGQFHLVVHIADFGIEAKLSDDRLNAGATEDLFLH